MLVVGGLVESRGSFALVFLLAGLMPLVAFGGLWLGTRPGGEAAAYGVAKSSAEGARL